MTSSSNTSAPGEVRVPVSVGELVDKITILEIKSERMSDAKRLRNVRTELAELSLAFEEVFPGDNRELEQLQRALKDVNSALWEIEDAIRARERDQNFDETFIALARSVYTTNDRRAALKREINLLVNSRLIEEKDYKPYQATDAVRLPSD